MREKPALAQSQSLGPRITPACAGKTRIKLLLLNEYRDHPRVCGKNLNGMIKDITHVGSPPRVREKLDSTKVLKYKDGITPACAGKTLIDPIEIANPD